VVNVAGGGEVSNCQPGMCNKIFDFLFKKKFVRISYKITNILM